MAFLGVGGAAAIAFGGAAFPGHAAQLLFVGMMAVFAAIGGLIIMLLWPCAEPEPEPGLDAGQWYIDHEPRNAR